jgi:hypothetical protein
MKPRARLLILIACLVAVPLIAASLQSQVHAQSGPFPTVPPPNATFQPPIHVGPTAQPGFVPVDLRAELGLGVRLRKAWGYMVAGAASLALGVTALWADRQRAKGASVLGPGGVAWSGPGPRRFSFRPRLRRLLWIIPSGAGLVLLGFAATKCVPPKVCFANVGGLRSLCHASKWRVL